MKADTHTTYTELLPTFYTDVFQEQELLQHLLKSVDLLQLQSAQDNHRNKLFTSVEEANPAHTEVVETLHLTKSRLTSIVYGSGLLYGNEDGDPEEEYGQQASSVYGVYDLGDPSIKSIGYIADGVDSPAHIYTEGIDFVVDNGMLILSDSASSLFPQLRDEDGDGLVDEPDFILTGYNVRRDNQELSKQFGHVFGISAPPTTCGKDIFTGLWKLHTFGPSWYWTMFTLCRALEAEVVRTKKEQVIAVKRSTPYGNVVVTQNNTYVVGGSPAAVGTVLYYGYPATTDIHVVHELDNVFDPGVPGVVSLPDGDGTVDVYPSPSPGGTVHLRPENLIIIHLQPGLSTAETVKLINVFEAVLAKNTKMIIIFTVSEPLGALGNISPDSHNSPIALETGIINPGTSKQTRSLNTSKLRASIR